MEIVIKKPIIPGAEKPGCERPPVYRGKPGPQGEAATIQIVDVVTIEPSDPARVENIGDKTNAKLILYIPKGDPGNRGEPGPAVEITEDIIQAIINELDLTPEIVGLGNVNNTSDMDKPVSKAQAEAIAAVQSDVDNHVADTNNPHGVTIAQIGAAPAGFGLGDSVWVSDGRSANDIMSNGWFSWGSGGVIDVPFPSGYMFVVARQSGKHVAQIAFNANYTGIGNTQSVVRTYGTNGWSEWEWINPPTQAGVEYRTTERFDGRPVYKYYLNYGYYSSSVTRIPHGISGMYTPISVNVINNEQIEMAHWSGITELTVDRTNINFKCTSDLGLVYSY